MYKLIVFDYDGSLVERGHTLDSVIQENIDKWWKQGIQISIASGRNFRSLKNVLQHLMVDLPIISNNGNIIRSLQSEKTLFKKTIEPEILTKSLEILRKNRLNPIFHVDSYFKGYDLVLLSMDSIAKSYLKYYENRYKIVNLEELYEEDVLSIVTYLDNTLYNKIHFELKESFEKVSTHHLTKGIDHTGMMEIIGQNSSKWRAVSVYSHLHNIKEQEIIAVGDDMNDLEMIQMAGIGIAMVNSPNSIASIADYVTDYTAKEYGAIKVINKILQNEVCK